MPVRTAPGVLTRSSPRAMPVCRWSRSGSGAVPGVLTRSSPRAMPVVAVRPRPWSRARRWLRAAVTWFDPGRCRRSARRRDPARGQRPELAAGSGRRSPGSTPGDADDPHVGRPGREARHRCRSAWPRAVVTRSSPSGRPWSPGSTPGDAGGPHVGRPGREARHRCRSARPWPWSPGSSPRAMPVVAVRPRPWSRARRRLRAASTGFDPGRCRRSARRRGPGRGHRVEPPGAVTWFDPGRWRRSARRPPRA